MVLRSALGALLGLASLGATLGVSACFSAEGEPSSSSSDAGPAPQVITLPDGAVIIGVVLPDGAIVEVPIPDAGDSGIAPVIPGIDAGNGFDYAPPYVQTLGPSSRSDAGHNFAANKPPSNPWKTRCVDCHKAGGSAASRPFFAGGSVRNRPDGGPAAMAEVRLKTYYAPNAVNAYTDDDGNWFIPLAAAQDAGVNFSVRPGIRNAAVTRIMPASPAAGWCNQCHSGSNYLL